MSNNKHTAAPWAITDIMDGSVSPENDSIDNKGWGYKSAWLRSGETIIGEVKAMKTGAFLHSFDEFYANAKLIAAAPELLEACQQMIKAFDDAPMSWLPTQGVMDAELLMAKAIKKST